MQFEISTAEAAEVFEVTKKTIALWSQQGIMVKLRHGTYDLKNSLRNYVAYQRCVFEGAADPLLRWQIRRDIRESAGYTPPDLSKLELVDIETLAVELPET